MPNPTQYRPKITQTPVSQRPQSIAMPSKLPDEPWDHESRNKGPGLWLTTLSLGIVFLLGFSVFSAVQGIIDSFSDYPVSASLLGSLLIAFVGCLIALMTREFRGYMQVNAFVSPHVSIAQLENVDDQHVLRQALKRHAGRFTKDSYAWRCYSQFEGSLNTDMTSEEIRGLYNSVVIEGVERKANEILKKESMVAGTVSFISPNALIQTLSIIWVSLRTIRRVALVFGLRPATIGNWKLFRVLAENIAAQSIFDIATDEITNQISGSLSAKFVENSAEAVAAGALNVRLGKALIKMLKD